MIEEFERRAIEAERRLDDLSKKYEELRSLVDAKRLTEVKIVTKEKKKQKNQSKRTLTDTFELHTQLEDVAQELASYLKIVPYDLRSVPVTDQQGNLVFDKSGKQVWQYPKGAVIEVDSTFFLSIFGKIVELLKQAEVPMKTIVDGKSFRFLYNTLKPHYYYWTRDQNQAWVPENLKVDDPAKLADFAILLRNASVHMQYCTKNVSAEKYFKLCGVSKKDLPPGVTDAKENNYLLYLYNFKSKNAPPNAVVPVHLGELRYWVHAFLLRVLSPYCKELPGTDVFGLPIDWLE